MSRIIVIFFLLISWTLSSQAVEEQFCINEKFEKTVHRYLKESVELVSVTELQEELSDEKKEIIVLDAREYEEYEISHIPGALYVGYDNLNETLLDSLDKNYNIVLYCSIGYRSEKIGEKMEEMGFQNVRNLFGSIFEWTNRGYEIENINGIKTNALHTYNKSWGKWVEASHIKKQN